jgi:hypothetical protein
MGVRRKRNQRSWLQFVIHNWVALNPMAVPDLDTAMAGAGAIPDVLGNTLWGVL